MHGVTGTGPAVEGAQISDPPHDRAIGGGGAGLLDEQGAKGAVGLPVVGIAGAWASGGPDDGYAEGVVAAAPQ